jgi:hypothetical protein
MTTKEKGINPFLIDGTTNGRIKYKCENCTGVIYKIPRKELEKCTDLQDLKHSVVYLMFGTSEKTGNKTVKVGQAVTRKNGAGPLRRLKEDKTNSLDDNWTDIVMVTTSDNSLAENEVSYLKKRFYKMAKEANRYEVKNRHTPHPLSVTDAEKRELEGFIGYIKIVLNDLGYIPFTSLTKKEEEEKDAKTVKHDGLPLYLEVRKVIKAECVKVENGFWLLKGSQIDIGSTHAEIPNEIKKKREKAMANGDIDIRGVLQKDIPFDSASYAAKFVIGGSVNGREKWKTKDGIPLREIEG